VTSHVFFLPVVLMAGAALFAWFYRLAAVNRQITIVTLILALIAIETALYEKISVPTGIFHPATGLFQVRTIDVVILIAVVANAAAGGAPRIVNRTAFFWVVFGIWVLTEGFVGFLNGNSRTFIGYETKAILYLGLFALASRVPLRDPSTRRSLERLLYFVAALVALIVTLGALGARVKVNVPGLRGAELGKIGSIGATLFVAFGVLALAIAVCSEHRRFSLLLAAVPLLIPPLMAHQRASLLNLVVSTAAVVLLLPVARHRLRATFVEVVLVVLAALAFVALPTLVGGVFESKRIVPFSHSLSEAITGGEKKLSAQDRVNQLHEARKLIVQRPVIGWGLGQTITYYEVGFQQFFTSYLTHNVVADLLVRCGVIGLVLFLLAIGSSVSQGIGAWRHASDPLVAAIALASVAIISGWIAHGMVESLFEHVQLAPLLGITLGFLQAAARTRTARASHTVPQLVPVAPGAPARV
jgi:O-antigen ligase